MVGVSPRRCQVRPRQQQATPKIAQLRVATARALEDAPSWPVLADKVQRPVSPGTETDDSKVIIVGPGPLSTHPGEQQPEEFEHFLRSLIYARAGF
jgi:hypothetical protein